MCTQLSVYDFTVACMLVYGLIIRQNEDKLIAHPCTSKQDYCRKENWSKKLVAAVRRTRHKRSVVACRENYQCCDSCEIMTYVR